MVISRVTVAVRGCYCWWGASEYFSEEVEGGLSWDLCGEKTMVMQVWGRGFTRTSKCIGTEMGKKIQYCWKFILKYWRAMRLGSSEAEEVGRGQIYEAV